MTHLRPGLPILLFVAIAVGACSNVGATDGNGAPTSQVATPTTTLAPASTSTTTTTLAPAPTTTTTLAPATTTTTTLASRTEDSGEAATLTIETVVNDSGSGGTFTASGDAVELGRFCAEGAFSNLDFNFSGDPQWFEDSYACDGIEGSIVLRIETPASDDEDEDDERQDVFGTWAVASATGAWEGTSGGGDYHGSFDPWVERYVGVLNFG